MNVSEGISLTKMAVAATLLALLLGIASTFFYTLYTNVIHKDSEVSDVMSTASLNKLYELVNMSSEALAEGDNDYDYPLVSAVINAFSEVTSNEILFYDVYQMYGDGNHVVFSLEDADITFTLGAGETVTPHPDRMPQDLCARYLYTYIGRRCSVTMTTHANGLYGIHIGLR